MVKTLFAIAFILCLLVLLFVYIYQDKLVFFPQKFSNDFDFNLSPNEKELFIETSDSEKINAIYATLPGNRNVVLYFHGNATSLNTWQAVADDLLSKGVNLLMIDYRGYGKSTGTFSENGFYKDAEAAYEYLKANGYNDSSIYFYGRSLGSGVAVEMATRHPVRGLVLEAPYTSMLQVAKNRHPYLLPHLLLKYKFNSLEKAGRIKTPVLILHGTNDAVIPVKQAYELFDAIKEEKKMIALKGGDHNNLSAFDNYYTALSNFLK